MAILQQGLESKMAKRVFFSFHYDDVKDFRANVVRQHWVTKPNREAAGFFDASIWESNKKSGSVALKRLINGGLENTSTTCVLIGSGTYLRPWVRYELLKSLKKGNNIVGIHINSIKCKKGLTKLNGPNPLEYLAVSFSDSGKLATLWQYGIFGWNEYKEIDGSSTYSVNIEPKFRGKSFKLSELFDTYDWQYNDGYNNFSTWVD